MIRYTKITLTVSMTACMGWGCSSNFPPVKEEVAVAKAPFTMADGVVKVWKVPLTSAQMNATADPIILPASSANDPAKNPTPAKACSLSTCGLESDNGVASIWPQFAPWTDGPDAYKTPGFVPDCTNGLTFNIVVKPPAGADALPGVYLTCEKKKPNGSGTGMAGTGAQLAKPCRWIAKRWLKGDAAAATKVTLSGGEVCHLQYASNTAPMPDVQPEPDAATCLGNSGG